MSHTLVPKINMLFHTGLTRCYFSSATKQVKPIFPLTRSNQHPRSESCITQNLLVNKTKQFTSSVICDIEIKLHLIFGMYSTFFSLSSPSRITVHYVFARTSSPFGSPTVQVFTLCYSLKFLGLPIIWLEASLSIIHKTQFPLLVTFPISLPLLALRISINVCHCSLLIPVTTPRDYPFCSLHVLVSTCTIFARIVPLLPRALCFWALLLLVPSLCRGHPTISGTQLVVSIPCHHIQIYHNVSTGAVSIQFALFSYIPFALKVPL